MKTDLREATRDKSADSSLSLASKLHTLSLHDLNLDLTRWENEKEWINSVENDKPVSLVTYSICFFLSVKFLLFN